jgi:hypothetical protein
VGVFQLTGRPAEATQPHGPRRRLARLVMPAAVLAVVVLVLVRADPRALVPRTVTGWVVVGAVVLALVLVRRAAGRWVPAGPARVVASWAPVLLVVGWVLLPAVVDRTVEEDLLSLVPAPVADRPPAGTSPDPPVMPAPVEVQQLTAGEIVGVGHRASGTAAVYRSGDTVFVRLEDLDVQGAPDVFVWLVDGADRRHPADGEELGALKGNRGSANYPVPAARGLDGDLTVLLWCRAFGTPIAAATLPRS